MFIEDVAKQDGTNGRITKIGNQNVYYDSDGRIDKVGNQNVYYDSDGRITKIGNQNVYYNSNGRITQIGNQNVNYHDYGTIAQIGNQGVYYDYSYNKVSTSTSGENKISVGESPAILLAKPKSTGSTKSSSAPEVVENQKKSCVLI